MKRTALLLFLTLILSAPAAYGQGFRNLYGQQEQYFTPRNLGLGGAGLASETGVSALFLNPALMAEQNNTYGFFAAAGYSGNEEERSIRVYDTFDNYLADQIYAMHSSGEPTGAGNFSWKLPWLKGFSPVVGLGIARVWTFGYEYREQLRDPDPYASIRDALYGYNNIESAGNIYQTALAFAVKPLENLYVGLNMGILSGEITQKKWVSAVAENNPPFTDSTLYDNTYSFDGLPFVGSLGLAWKADERFTFGAVFYWPYTMNFSGGYYYESPLRIGFGVDYRARNINWARINFDVEYAAWSGVENKWSFGSEGEISGNPDWRDTWTFKVGIEHLFHEAFPFRVGFNYRQIPQQKKINDFLITLGTGYVSGPFVFEISGGAGSKNYRQEDIFPNSLNGAPDRVGDAAVDQVKDVYMQLMASFTYLF
jgi:hypothetical protein